MPTSSDATRYPPEYFAKRDATDPKRQASFLQEMAWLRSHGIDDMLSVCDVGCATGEFLGTVGWRGPRYGMEISAHARSIARTRAIRFHRHILNTASFFDVVLFRGTIQHLDEPFRYLRAAYSALKPGGHVVFLQTPNAGSIVYRLFQDLPALEPTRNWFIPSEKTLSNALTNAGFVHVVTRKAYRSSPYASPWRDHWRFVRQFFTRERPSFAFYGNMMDMIWRKPV